MPSHDRVVTTTFKLQSAQLTLRFEEEHLAKLVDLRSEDRRKGHATALLQEVVRHADDEGISLWLEVQRYGRPGGGLDNSQLITFYERFGFDLQDDDRRPRWMTRDPLERRQ